MNRWYWLIAFSLLVVISCGKVEDPNKMTLKAVNSNDVILPVYDKEVVKIAPGESKKIPILIKNPIAATRKYKISVEPEKAPEGWVLAVCEGEACYPWGFESEIAGMSKKIYQFQVQVPEKEVSGKKIDAYFVFYPVDESKLKVKVHVEITVT
jgi:hypothetical protein